MFKLYCDISSDEHSNINTYRQRILEVYPEIVNQKVKIMNSNLEIYPFMIWNTRNDETDNNNNESWWTGYNKIKHSRTSSYKEANLKNTLYALAALYLIEMKIMKNIMENSLVEYGSPTVPDNPGHESEIFTLHNWEYRFVKKEILYRIDNEVSI